MNSGSGRPTTTVLPVGCRLAMLLINFTPLLHTLLLLFFLVIPPGPWWQRTLLAACCLYLLPPLLAWPLRRWIGIREGVHPLGSRDFLLWWALFSLQVIFCRFPFLEEGLRLVPGLYSAWLRLWGAKIGRLTYWASGTTILDRSFVTIGNDVIFGAGVKLNPHVLTVNSNGASELLLATVTIGDQAIIGGYSLLTAGTEIAAGESVRAYLISPPFSRWQGGRRVKVADSDAGSTQ